MGRFRSFRRGTKSRGGGRRGRDILIAFCMILLLALVASRLQQAASETLSGPVQVIDGDSLVLADRRLRLIGIDAPEFDQQCKINSLPSSCGRISADYLRKLVGGQEVSCRLEGQDKYGRDLAACKSGKFDLNSEMVRSGQAVAYGDYEAFEALARAERVGLWAGEFDPPAEWRQAHHGLDEPLHKSSTRFWTLITQQLGIK